MLPFPTGTVTFLFTDIEGSTRLLQELGHEYARVLTDHRHLLRSAIQSHKGYEVDTQGDAFFYAFPRARDALEAALAVQGALATHSWTGDASVRVRIGVHTGEPLVADSGYVGMAVHRAARICAAAHGGQVLLSQATAELLEEDLPDGVTLRDLGEHKLKDLLRPQRLFQVVSSHMPSEFPPLKTLSSLPNNLPRQLASFVGREREIAEIEELLSRTLLLTLTGVGGSGKTRLALQVTAELLDQYSDGAWAVELAPLSDPGLVPQAVVSALGVHEQPGRPLMSTLLDYLRPKTLLLLLDNAEHVLSASASLVDTLLHQCPKLRILATSREALRVEGEHIYPVPPLSMPSAEMPPSVGTLSQYESARLFIDRAVAVRPSFTATAQNAAAIVQICRRVDGIPLALELAAARVKALSVGEIASRLDDQFRLLADGARTRLPHHQTLRATMDWSFDLLTEGEKILFRRLAVFAGGFTLQAAERVCSGSALEGADIVDLLTHLVEKSLVVAEDRAAGVRYRLLEPVRQYALNMLVQAGEDSEIRGRHRDFFLALAEKGYVAMPTAEAPAWLTRLDDEHENIRTSLRWSISEGDLEGSAHLASAMTRFWYFRGSLNEGWTWLHELANQSQQLSVAARAKLLSRAGLLAYARGDYRQAVRLGEEALGIFRQIGDTEEIGTSLYRVGCAEMARGNHERAAALLEESAAFALQAGEARRVLYADALRQRGHVAARHGDYGLATALLEESLSIFRQLGIMRWSGFALRHLGLVKYYQGQLDQAATLLREGLAGFREVSDKEGISYLLSALGLVLRNMGDQEGARDAYRESLILSSEIGYRWAMIESLIGFAALSASSGRNPWAVRLLAAADALRESTQYALPLAEQAEFDALAGDLRVRLGERAFATSWTEGQAMPLKHAIEYALQQDATVD